MPLQALIFSSPHIFITHLNSTSLISTAQTIFKQPLTCSKFAVLSNASHQETEGSTIYEEIIAEMVHNNATKLHSGPLIIEDNLVKLRQKVEDLGISCSSFMPGVFTYMKCPKCEGGPLLERSLSFHIIQSGESVIWRCFNLECCWAGQMYAVDGIEISRINQKGRIAPRNRLSEETVRLEPLGHQLIAYFAKRMISKETLEKNHVMQRADDQNVIAFTYRRDGMLVGCKYRSIKKRFWQMKGAEKIFYGVDDIKDADEIIIVEGEVDKLSMNEVGFCNCVSVPNGAPPSVSDKETSIEEDVGFQYLWKEKEYMEKASRIILATDGDIPGQALAKELARRVGIERCWQVRWPKKDEFSFCNDANEVLVNLGADALREAVKNAECYQMQNEN